MDPTAVAPLYHWYVGEVPPPSGVAVKNTTVPSQTVLASGAIVTLAGISGFTFMVIVLEVAGEPLRQGVALEVITTFIASPFEGTYA